MSNVDSVVSSHFLGAGNRNPAGGGPDGVAYARRPIDGSAYNGLVVGVNVRTELISDAAGRLRATSIVKGLVAAIVWLLVAVLLK